MFEKLMINLRPDELKKLREVLIEAYNTRANEFKVDLDHWLCEPMYYISKAIDHIDLSM